MDNWTAFVALRKLTARKLTRRALKSKRKDGSLNFEKVFEAAKLADVMLNNLPLRTFWRDDCVLLFKVTFKNTPIPVSESLNLRCSLANVDPNETIILRDWGSNQSEPMLASHTEAYINPGGLLKVAWRQEEALASLMIAVPLHHCIAALLQPPIKVEIGSKLWAEIRLYSADATGLNVAFHERFSFFHSEEGAELIPSAYGSSFRVKLDGIQLQTSAFRIAIDSCLILVIIYNDSMQVLESSAEFAACVKEDTKQWSMNDPSLSTFVSQTEWISLKITLSHDTTPQFVVSMKLNYIQRDESDKPGYNTDTVYACRVSSPRTSASVAASLRLIFHGQRVCEFTASIKKYIRASLSNVPSPLSIISNSELVI